MLNRLYAGIHPCAFCPIKNTIPCKYCSEQFQSAVLEEDVSEVFLIERDMSITEFSGITPFFH
jgi:hypothetical protein